MFCFKEVVLYFTEYKNVGNVSIYTACQPSCGKVMFSQASLSHSVRRGNGYLWSHVLSRGGWILTPCIHGPRTLRDTVDKRVVRILLELVILIVLLQSSYYKFVRQYYHFRGDGAARNITRLECGVDFLGVPHCFLGEGLTEERWLPLTSCSCLLNCIILRS